MKKEVRYIQKDNKKYRVEKTLFGEKTELVSEKDSDGRWKKPNSDMEILSSVMQFAIWLFFGLFLLVYYLFVWIFNKNAKYNVDNANLSLNGTHSGNMTKLSTEIDKAESRKIKLVLVLAMLIFVGVNCLIVAFIGGLGIFSSMRTNDVSYHITYYASTGGYIAVSGRDTKYSKYSFNINSGQTGEYVQAVPDIGYVFCKWSDGNQNATRQEKNIKATLEVTAYFNKKQENDHSLSVTYSASDGGTISGVKNQSGTKGFNCTSVTAIANFGCRFVGWSDNLKTETRTDKDVQENKEITAMFEKYFDGGLGTMQSPFLISNLEQLKNFANIINNGTTSSSRDYYTSSYKLIHNIELPTNEDWKPIGIIQLYKFKGNFDGGNYTISNLTIKSNVGSHLGLFGYCENSTIQSVVVENVNINLKGDVVYNCGAIVGTAKNCSINDCSSNGFININSNGETGYVVSIGGIVGTKRDLTIITNCSSTITMNGNSTGHNPPSVIKVFTVTIFCRAL